VGITGTYAGTDTARDSSNKKTGNYLELPAFVFGAEGGNRWRKKK